MNNDNQRPRPGLLREIEQFDIDGGAAAFSFARRLARENGWSTGYAERVIAEYKRFVYLAMTAPHMVTPSDEVDQAWHLHMLYTESYWTRLCGEILPRPLTHGPTKGGKSENARFRDLYTQTLVSYMEAFGEPPPTDIWPSVDERFTRSLQFQRVNVAESWVISKAKMKRTLTGAAAVAGVGGLAGCGAMAGSTAGALGFFAFVAIGVVILVVIAVVMSRDPNRRHTGCSSSGCGAHGVYHSDSGSSGSSDSGNCDGGGSGCSSSGCGGGGCGGGGCGG